MDSKIAISASGLGKMYRKGQRGGYDTLRERISSFGRTGDTAPSSEFWALKDVDFEVREGDVVGIIGRNGAGKSTLLKVLTRVTAPTEGRAELRGRVGALLEVGSGFHPELTGRENIYLNGAILGMKRNEIRARYDEIVEFSGVEAFLETPVKRYSSGMYARLAFSVAAHLEPEILIVDEVLAVGDSKFQEKCLGRMSEVARGGRTVLFVSHNMAAVSSLCKTAVTISGGRVVDSGDPRTVISRYLADVRDQGSRSFVDRDRKGTGRIRLTEWSLESMDGESIQSAYSGQDIRIRIHYESEETGPIGAVFPQIAVSGLFGQSLFVLLSRASGSELTIPPNGSMVCEIPRLPLVPGAYVFDVWCKVGGEMADWIQHAGSLRVEEGDFYGTGKLPTIETGEMLVEHSWGVARCEEGSDHGLA